MRFCWNGWSGELNPWSDGAAIRVSVRPISVFALIRRLYLIAMGFSGDPTAPGIFRGWAAMKNS